MNFVHEDPEFGALLRIAAQRKGISVALVEKDYWVTHTLWGLHDLGLEVWFKGGTSLSKGFGLIERFSEDLDLKIEGGRVRSLPVVGNWTSEGKAAVAARKKRFEALAEEIRIPGASVRLDLDDVDPVHRAARIRVAYLGLHAADLAAPLKPFVLLEVGSARVTPWVPRELSSFVHDELRAQGKLSEFRENLPRAVRCVHPLVTLLEKLDALAKRAPRLEAPAALFVRHVEDAARIVLARDRLPPLEGTRGVTGLAEEMVRLKQVKGIPRLGDGILGPLPLERDRAIRAAYDEIRYLYWGPRLSYDEARAAIRGWVARDFPNRAD